MPLDTSYIDAIQNAYAMRNRGIQQFGEGLTKAAAGITGALLTRRKDASQAQADLDREQGDVQMQERQLIDELANIRAAKQAQGVGQYERAQLDKAEAETTSRLRDIGAYQSELGAIGDITPRNVYATRMPSKLQPIGDASYSGRVADIQAGDKARAAADDAARKAAEEERDRAERIAAENRRRADKIAEEERAAARQAKKEAEKAKDESGAALTAGETTPIATNLNTIKGTLEHIRTGAANRDKFGRVAGNVELAKSKLSGSGFGETMRSGAKRLAVSQARVRTQGNPTESDIAAAQDVAGDVSLEYDQWLKNQLTVLDEAINQTELQIKLTRDGAQKTAMIAELEAAKAQRAELGKGNAPAQPKRGFTPAGR